MKVSIIIPAYNVQNEISRCLRSMINQVYKNIEIIVVDDASTDNTRSIIKKYAEKDNRIIPFYQTINKGVSAARNTGLMAATGDYIIFVELPIRFFCKNRYSSSSLRIFTRSARRYSGRLFSSGYIPQISTPITSYSVTSVFNICSSIPIDIFPWSQFVTAYFSSSTSLSDRKSVV